MNDAYSLIEQFSFPQHSDNLDEQSHVELLLEKFPLNEEQRERVTLNAQRMVQAVRHDPQTTLMDQLLSAYSLSSSEGVALMSLAEALLRVPDTPTKDALITDKIPGHNWLGSSSDGLVKIAGAALTLTGDILDTKQTNTLHQAARRLGMPIIRKAVQQTMQMMGEQFVYATNIRDAVKQANSGNSIANEGENDISQYYSFDMLGEAARTEEDAERYFTAYNDAINTLNQAGKGRSVHSNHGISVKLSALYGRYQLNKKDAVYEHLLPRLSKLVQNARAKNIVLTIDAEEMARLELSMDIIKLVLSDPELRGWDGFAVVVQAYSKYAGFVIDWLYELAENLDRRIAVRLVKGAYWDSEIKIAQEKGVTHFPLFTKKSHTDLAYICLAKSLLDKRDRIYPQFASHNAHTVAAILELATDIEGDCFEFQRLHGMGDRLHLEVDKQFGRKSRIYAPVGSHENLLAYLVRRLLENGANSSFVHKLMDEDIPLEEVVSDPYRGVKENSAVPSSLIAQPADMFLPGHINSKGWDLDARSTLTSLTQTQNSYATHVWEGNALVHGSDKRSDQSLPVFNPANTKQQVGHIVEADQNDVELAYKNAKNAQQSWQKLGFVQRAKLLDKIASAFEDNAAELFAMLTREAGKTIDDAIAELREAVDFCRYYADQARSFEIVQSNDSVQDGTTNKDNNSAEVPSLNTSALGTIVCISPWNFPLAIFTGQIVASLVTGNTVIAKPAEQTPLIAFRAVSLMHEVGIPTDVLQLLPGDGERIGGKLVQHPHLNGIVFTGSTQTAKIIERSIVDNNQNNIPIVAETGGINAMIVDSTALLERAVDDIIASAFRSAGQRCSALRMLYVQSDIYDQLVIMLKGALALQSVGNPIDTATDIGPLIDQQAHVHIHNYIEAKQNSGDVLFRGNPVEGGHFLAPVAISVKGIQDLKQEIFGPVLHIAPFELSKINSVIDAINRSGYGLTFGLHSRLSTRHNQLADQVHAGNIYINRNQIGAIVGSQPFGGMGKSGTGPKAGGPNYLKRLLKCPVESIMDNQLTASDKIELLPGPDGEKNEYRVEPRGHVVCLGSQPTTLLEQVCLSLSTGNNVTAIHVDAKEILKSLVGHEKLRLINLRCTHREEYKPLQQLLNASSVQAVCCQENPHHLQTLRKVLNKSSDSIVPLLSRESDYIQLVHEKHICIDTTAAGGNVALMASEQLM